MYHMDNKQSPNSFRILVDAEQSYIQRAIESVCEQMLHKYNRHRLYIISTIQNYLKQAVERTRYEVEVAGRRDLYFGAKLVRGAYLVEETRVARETGGLFPIVDCFEQTTTNYL